MPAGRARPGRCPPTPSSSSPTAPGTGRRTGASRASGIVRSALPWPARPASRPDRPAGAGPGRGRRRRGAARRARRRRAGRPIGLERRLDRRDVREAELAEIEGAFAAIVFWHSLEHLRDAGATLDRAARATRARRRDRGRDAEPRQPAGAGVRRSLARSRSAPPPRPRPGAGAARAPAGAGARAHPGQLPARRAGRLRLAPRHRRQPALGHPDLYDAIRRPEARRRPMSAGAAGR